MELPGICKELAMKAAGLVVVSGPTVSGKSTTLAAMAAAHQCQQDVPHTHH